jgi:prenylated cyclic peptide (anacyclamide/piricyclamide family)
MKKRNLKPTQTAPVERPQAGSTSRDPLAMFAAGGVGAASKGGRLVPFAGDDAE